MAIPRLLPRFKHRAARIWGSHDFAADLADGVTITSVEARISRVLGPDQTTRVTEEFTPEGEDGLVTSVSAGVVSYLLPAAASAGHQTEAEYVLYLAATLSDAGVVVAHPPGSRPDDLIRFTVVDTTDGDDA